jgi:hypothetical protein
MLWPVFWESVRPRPSIRALGTSKKEQGRVGRAGSLETLSHGSAILFGRVGPFGLLQMQAVLQILAFWCVSGAGLVVFVGVRQPIRLRHAVSRLWPSPWSGGLLQPAVASSGRGASRGNP